MSLIHDASDVESLRLSVYAHPLLLTATISFFSPLASLSLASTLSCLALTRRSSGPSSSDETTTCSACLRLADISE